MPCRVDPTPEEIARSLVNQRATIDRAKRTEEAEAKVTKAQTKAQKDAETINALSVALDYTRDLLWRVWNINSEEVEFSDSKLASEVRTALITQQKHRQADLDRLIQTLGKNPTKKNKELLLKVLSADISKPLEPQLGFDPDSI